MELTLTALNTALAQFASDNRTAIVIIALIGFAAASALLGRMHTVRSTSISKFKKLKSHAK